MAVTTINSTQKIDEWFDDFVAQLRSHKIQIETGTISNEMASFYSSIVNGNADEVAQVSKSAIQKHFVSRIIFDYLNQIKSTPLRKLAFNFNDSEVLVWAEIENNNSEVELNLLRTQAQINATFHNYGFDMETTIVEEEDGLDIPNHYQKYI